MLLLLFSSKGVGFMGGVYFMFLLLGEMCVVCVDMAVEISCVCAYLVLAAYLASGLEVYGYSDQ